MSIWWAAMTNSSGPSNTESPGVCLISGIYKQRSGSKVRSWGEEHVLNGDVCWSSWVLPAMPQGQRTGTLNKYIYDDRHTSPTIYWTTANELKSYFEHNERRKWWSAVAFTRRRVWDCFLFSGLVLFPCPTDIYPYQTKDSVLRGCDGI